MANMGRERTGSFGARNGGKRTFVYGDSFRDGSNSKWSGLGWNFLFS